MREIKFRGKKIFGNEFVYGHYLVINNRHFILPFDSHINITGYFDKQKCFGHIEQHGNDWIIEVDPETVGQYIGRNDDNNNEIFEGHIVECVYDGVLSTYVVVFDFDELDFKATNGQENYSSNYNYLNCCESVKIIGNINDNPELVD